jgi:hypothetical protein
LSKIFEFTSNAVIFFLKKKKCDIFIEKSRAKVEKIIKKIEKNLRNDQRKFDRFWKHCKNIAVTSQNNL